MIIGIYFFIFFLKISFNLVFKRKFYIFFIVKILDY